MEFIVQPTELFEEKSDGCVVNGVCAAHACGINGSACAGNAGN